MTHRDLDACLRQLVILGTLAVLLVPAARGSSDLLGRHADTHPATPHMQLEDGQ